MNQYIKYGKNIFTQFGEDGIIEKIFSDLKIIDGIVVEFGAWDGIYLSNVYNLWRYKGFKAILIEGDKNRAEELHKISKKYNKVQSVNVFVNPDKNHFNSIDNILSRSSFNVNNDNLALMSIDVDSCDYFIFNSLEKYRPKVVIIETNTDKLNEFATYDQGCSLFSLNKLAMSKNYTLVCHTGNAFFIRNDLMHLIPNGNYSVEFLQCDTKKVHELAEIGSDQKEIYFQSKKYNYQIELERKNLF
jgi:hypothetical protein